MPEQQKSSLKVTVPILILVLVGAIVFFVTSRTGGVTKEDAVVAPPSARTVERSPEPQVGQENSPSGEEATETQMKPLPSSDGSITLEEARVQIDAINAKLETGMITEEEANAQITETTKKLPPPPLPSQMPPPPQVKVEN